MSITTPRARPPQFSFVAAPVAEQETETVARRDASGSRSWGINIGKFNSRYEAERVLLRMALAEMTTLDGAERKVKARASGYEALFTGLTQHSADLACRTAPCTGNFLRVGRSKLKRKPPLAKAAEYSTKSALLLSRICRIHGA